VQMHEAQHSGMMYGMQHCLVLGCFTHACDDLPVPVLQEAQLVIDTD
jgi:hypothetical protein